jgi:hypothetical protein
MKSEDVMNAIVPASRVPPGHWAGLSIICGYAVVPLMVGGWLMSRRDA